MDIGRKEFEELQNIARRLEALRAECETLKNEAKEVKKRFGRGLSKWAREWIIKVEMTCENAEFDFSRAVNKSIPFLMTSSLPWRKGENAETATCASCGKPVNRILTIRRWEEDKEILYCVSCLMSTA